MSKKISELTDAATLDGNELIELVQSGGNNKISLDALFSATLWGDRTVQLNGHNYRLIEEDYPIDAFRVLFEPESEDSMRVDMNAFNETGNGNYAYSLHQATNLGGDMQIAAAFNDGAIQANIHLYANETDGGVCNIFADKFQLQTLQDFADDTAAGSGGVAVNGLYHTSGTVKIRLS